MSYERFKKQGFLKHFLNFSFNILDFSKIVDEFEKGHILLGKLFFLNSTSFWKKKVGYATLAFMVFCKNKEKRKVTPNFIYIFFYFSYSSFFNNNKLYVYFYLILNNFIQYLISRQIFRLAHLLRFLNYYKKNDTYKITFFYAIYLFKFFFILKFNYFYKLVFAPCDIPYQQNKNKSNCSPMQTTTNHIIKHR